MHNKAHKEVSLKVWVIGGLNKELFNNQIANGYYNSNGSIAKVQNQGK